MRLRDVRALERRLALKSRDDPTDQLPLVIVDSRANRRVLDEFGGSIGDLARIRKADVVRSLAAGRHPPTGLVLI
jgi:hypothetical protein